MNIIIYNSASGQIIKSVSCPDGNEDIQCADGQSWIEHDAVDDSIYMIDINTHDIIPIPTETA